MSDERLLVGLMSGTSADGIDAALVRCRGDAVELLAHAHAAHPPDLRERLLAASDARAPELARLHVELGHRFADAALAALELGGAAPQDVAAVACAGVTVAHLPPGPDDAGATLCLGDGDVIAERTGCLVVADLRARDRAAGGHGAPLVPYADVRLLREPGATRAALNVGGIANLTVVPPAGEPLAFDTGPGNMLLDGALARATGGRVRFDEGGRLGLAGTVDEGVLGALVDADDFLRESPPRSTGRERYGAAFLDRHAGLLLPLAVEDLAATLAAYTAEAAANALLEVARATPRDLVVSGGGALNRCLMRALAERAAPVAVTTSAEALGIPVLAKEAVAFALLADATLRGEPSAYPRVTGARRASVLGKLCPPPTRGDT